MRRVARITVGPRVSKYGAKRTVVDGMTFHSQKEARRYQELKLLEKAGVIEAVECQPRFELLVCKVTGQPAYPTITLPHVVIGRYIADFQYYDRRSCERVVEDVKSPPTRTPIYRWKVKHLKAQYGIEVREV